MTDDFSRAVAINAVRSDNRNCRSARSSAGVWEVAINAVRSDNRNCRSARSSAGVWEVAINAVRSDNRNLYLRTSIVDAAAVSQSTLCGAITATEAEHDR